MENLLVLWKAFGLWIFYAGNLRNSNKLQERRKTSNQTKRECGGGKPAHFLQTLGGVAFVR